MSATSMPMKIGPTYIGGAQKGAFVTYTDMDMVRETAIVTRVHPDGTVNLTVLADGTILFRKNVEKGTGRGQWRW